MLENEKLECIESIKFGISRCAVWREKIGAQYPLDTRNGRAADCLARLATSPAELSDEAWLHLQPHFDWGAEPWREAISQTSRLVGFKQKITTLPAFVTALIGVLRALSRQHRNVANTCWRKFAPGGRALASAPL